MCTLCAKGAAAPSLPEKLAHQVHIEIMDRGHCVDARAATRRQRQELQSPHSISHQVWTTPLEAPKSAAMPWWAAPAPAAPEAGGSFRRHVAAGGPAKGEAAAMNFAHTITSATRQPSAKFGLDPSLYTGGAGADAGAGAGAGAGADAKLKGRIVVNRSKHTVSELGANTR
jgi:hypothetical protein